MCTGLGSGETAAFGDRGQNQNPHIRGAGMGFLPRWSLSVFVFNVRRGASRSEVAVIKRGDVEQRAWCEAGRGLSEVLSGFTVWICPSSACHLVTSPGGCPTCFVSLRVPTLRFRAGPGAAQLSFTPAPSPVPRTDVWLPVHTPWKARG